MWQIFARKFVMDMEHADAGQKRLNIMKVRNRMSWCPKQWSLRRPSSYNHYHLGFPPGFILLYSSFIFLSCGSYLCMLCAGDEDAACWLLQAQRRCPNAARKVCQVGMTCFPLDHSIRLKCTCPCNKCRFTTPRCLFYRRLDLYSFCIPGSWLQYLFTVHLGNSRNRCLYDQI